MDGRKSRLCLVLVLSLCALSCTTTRPLLADTFVIRGGHWGGAFAPPSAALTGDFDGDGCTDIAAWDRLSHNVTVALGDPDQLNFQPSSAWLHTDTTPDGILVGDFNGDFKSDLAVWSTSDRAWHVALASVPKFNPSNEWTLPIPSGGQSLVGDFDGNGKADIALWDPSSRSWMVALSLSDRDGFAPARPWISAFGGPGITLVGDFNGDGRADLAGWNEPDRAWHVALSTGSGFDPSAGYWITDFGAPGLVLVGDFNGDGLSDLAGWNGVVHGWHVALSTGSSFDASSGIWIAVFGSPGNMMVGEFNRDGQTDLGAWNATDRAWDIAVSGHKTVFGDPMATDITFTNGANVFVEATAAVPPPAVCGVMGKVMIFDGQSGTLHTGSLGSGPAEAPVVLHANRTDHPSTDSQLLRLNNGNLLILRVGFTDAPLSTSPAWWDFTGGGRTAFFLWQSSDCGRNWTELPVIDSATLPVGGEVGKCAWPQDHPELPAHWLPGWDRPVVYADPWNGNIYLMTGCLAGSEPPNTPARFPGHFFSQEIMLVSKDGGRTWAVTLQLPDWEGVAMTSTHSGKLFLLQTIGPSPILHWSEDQGATFSPGVDVFYPGGPAQVSDQVGLVPDAAIVGRQLNDGRPVGGVASLSRVNTGASGDGVRVAYSSEVAGQGRPRQIERVVYVNVHSATKFTITPSAVIEAEDPRGSVLQATFVEADRVALRDDDPVDIAVLYWLESVPSTGRLLARYRVVRDGREWSAIRDASLLSGTRRVWDPQKSGGWAGDYLGGGFFAQGADLRYVLQWSEPDPIGPTPNMNLHYNIITVSR